MLSCGHGVTTGDGRRVSIMLRWHLDCSTTEDLFGIRRNSMNVCCTQWLKTAMPTGDCSYPGDLSLSFLQRTRALFSLFPGSNWLFSWVDVVYLGEPA